MILLVSVPSVINSVVPRVSDPPLGLGFIAAFLKKNGFDVKLLDLASNPLSISKMSEIIVENKPSLVGFTCYNSNYYLIKQIISKVKARLPTLQVVIGGPTPTFSDLEIFQDTKAIDFIIRGEGEWTMYELVNELENKTNNFKDILGLSFLEGAKVIQNPDRPLEQNLDHFPSPYLTDIFEMDLYQKGSIITGRGCNQRCMFCNCGIMFGHKIRHHSVERIMSEIDKLVVNYNINQIHFHDDAFSTNIEFAKKVLKEIIQRNYRLQIWMETRIDRLDDELLKLMRKANVKQLNFGLESGDPEILKFIRKVRYAGPGFEPEIKFLGKFREIFTSDWKNEFHLTFSFIIGHPHETFANAQTTIDFVKLLGERRGALNILALVQGTEIWNRKDEFGMEYEHHPKMYFPYRILKFSKMTKKEILDIVAQIPNNMLASSYKHDLPQTICKQVLGVPLSDHLGEITRKTFEFPDESIITLAKKYLFYGDN